MNNRLLVVASLVVLVLCVESFRDDGSDSQSPTRTPVERQDLTISETDVAARTSRDVLHDSIIRNGVRACVTLARLDEYDRLAYQGDANGLAYLLAEGHCAHLAKGTRISLIDEAGFMRPRVKLRVYGKKSTAEAWADRDAVYGPP
jgi:hypothetical protein